MHLRSLSVSLVASLACVLGLSMAASSQTITDVTPTEGTLGTVLTIDFTGDIGKGKPKVWLTQSGDESAKPKKYALKVLDVVVDGEGGTIMAEIKKAFAGDFDLNVQAKGKGTVAAVENSAFTVNAPSLVSGPLPATANVGEQVMLTLADLGAKKPKVSVGGKKTKVKAMVEEIDGSTTITFAIPKSLANGNWPVVVTNKVGESTGESVVAVTGSTKKIGKSFLTAVVDGTTLTFKGKKLGVEAAGGGLQILGTSLTNPSKSVAIIVPFVAIGSLDQSDLASISYTEASFNGGSPNVAIWQTGIPAIEIIIQSVSGGQFAGTFSGTLVQLGVSSVSISGEFIVEASAD